MSALLVSSCCCLLLGRMLGHHTASHVVSHQAKEEDTALLAGVYVTRWYEGAQSCLFLSAKEGLFKNNTLQMVSCQGVLQDPDFKFPSGTSHSVALLPLQFYVATSLLLLDVPTHTSINTPCWHEARGSCSGCSTSILHPSRPSNTENLPHQAAAQRWPPTENPTDHINAPETSIPTGILPLSRGHLCRVRAACC